MTNAEDAKIEEVEVAAGSRRGMRVGAAGQNIDHMLKQTRGHHVQLSLMADMKANMMLTVASLIIPLSARYLTEPAYYLAAYTMIGFCILTIALAAYSAMPKLFNPLGALKPPKSVDEDGFNILFFGDFVGMEYDAYVAEMEKVINDPGALYEAQVREIYLLGQYLAHKKYRFLQFSYLAFLCGLMMSSLVFFLETTLGR